MVSQQASLLSRFYGISDTLLPGTQDSAAFLAAHLTETQNKTIAVIINADVLHELDNINTQKVLRRLAPSVPVIIVGVRADSDLNGLKVWTGEVVKNVHNATDFAGHYLIHKHPITQQLAEQKVAWQHPDISSLALAPHDTVETIIELENDISQPIFIQTKQHDLTVFVASYIQPEALFDEMRVWRLDTRRFLQIAPLMLVLQSSCGDYCWHSPKRLANLTIDDPWLTEPYGLLSFQGLLKEMQTARFHTTIGFIPWNYDRSESEAIEIFKNNSDYYSLTIHGNNHDHREFYKYETSEEDVWAAKPLEQHDFNLQQGLARLEKFRELTGLNYDQVMVFPHNIAPEKTLALMKNYNFLATSNGGNIPLGTPAPTDPLFYFRNVSTQFANFPSLDRLEPSEYSAANIALDLYLGNPLLFFEHILYFSDGLDAFNETAAYVNRLQADVQWASLGDIAQHLYLQRKVADNEYEVKALGRLLKFYNPSAETMTFTVFKEIIEGEHVSHIALNDMLQSYHYTAGNNYFTMAFSLPPKETRVLEIKYKNTLDLSTVELTKHDPAINRLRWWSDVRDISVSGTGLGRWFVQWYYASDTYKGGLKQLLIFLLLAVLIFSVLLWFFIRYWRRSKTILHQ